jgi:hypothetical protein
MLRKLARLNYSSFEGHLDWSFDVPEVRRATVEDPSAMSALRETMYLRGAYRVSMAERLGAILDSIEGTSLKDFLINGQPEYLIDGFTPTHSEEALLRDTFLVSSLRSFHQALTESPNLRNHVVDLRTNDTLEHMYQENLLELTSISLPMRQHEAYIGGISWFFEFTSLFHQQDFGAYRSEEWTTKMDGGLISSFLVRNRRTGITAFGSDVPEVVSGIADRMAEQDGDFMFIRVLRATTFATQRARIRLNAAQPTRDNVFTLWIRESLPGVGQFRPIRRDRPLVEQLLDYPPNLTSLIFSADNSDNSDDENWARPSYASSRPESESAEASEQRLCRACHQLKTRVSFSNKQWRKGRGASRCRSCVDSAAW